MMKIIVLLAVVCLAFSKTFVAEAPKENGMACNLCQNGAAIVKDYLTKPDEALLGMMFRLCTKIPSAYEGACKGAVASMGKEVLKLIRTTFADTPREVCEKMGACAQTEFSVQDAANYQFMKKVNDFIHKRTKQCNLDELREFYYWLPPSMQAEIKRQLIEQIYGQFPRLKYEVVEKLVSDMFNMDIPAQKVCDDMERIIIPEAQRRQRCQEECIAKIDLSIMRIYRTIERCRLQINCYMREIAEELQNVAKCAHECYMAPDSKPMIL
eukprot:gene1848-989_t